MDLNYDLHSHSTASDGTLSPTALVERAKAANVDVLALTDHDDVSGIVPAGDAANRLGLKLVAGIELSVTWQHQTIHVVGLQIDTKNPELEAGILRQHSFRHWRAEEIAHRLEKKGIAGALDGARAFAKGPIVSRTHFARYLVAQGLADNVQQVFKKFLVRGKPGFVPGQWASLEEAMHWIHAAGGQAVIAHPARYRLSATGMRRLLEAFKNLGGEGLEVISGSHSLDDSRHMATLASQFNLLASRGSDYHGPENPYVQLGRLPGVPENCVPIWQSEQWCKKATV
jgi:predicted metal-dependent phosphoesterase TrpH